MHDTEPADWPVARTIDGVTVVEGLRVLDYNIDPGTVHSVDHIAQDGTPWFNIALDKGGMSMMDGLRMWTRLRTNSGVETPGDGPARAEA